MPILPVVFLILWMPSSVTSAQQLCGSELTTMLELICGGQFYTVHSKRSSPRISSEVIDDQFNSLASIIVGKRGVADECCIKSCGYDTLQSYCLYDVVQKPRTTVNPVATTTTTVPMTTGSVENQAPSTEPIRAVGSVRSRQRNRWFFLQAVGHNPTRQPFRLFYRQP